MKKGLMLFIFFLLTGCASIRVVPKGCKTDAVFASNPASSREVTYEEIENLKNEVVATKTYTTLTDKEVRLKDLLSEAGVKCEELKKLRVKISTSWFVFREVQIRALRYDSGQGQGE